MTCSLINERVKTAIDNLYADAGNPNRRPPAGKPDSPRGNELDHYRARRFDYMAVGRELGKLLYSMARAANAKTIVEFGTSFGISTIHLAAAIRDNGGGSVITTEFIAEKSAQAKMNLAAAGLDDCVDFRVGDARESLRADLPPQVDMIFLDGAKDMYFDVLKIIEPSLRPGAVIVSDNTDHDGMQAFLAYIRDPKNGYVSSAIGTTDRPHLSGHEITLRV